MPTVLKIRGFIFMIYLADHYPPHVHVLKAGKRAKVNIYLAEVVDNAGFTAGDLKKIRRIIKKHEAKLLAAWHDIHGE